MLVVSVQVRSDFFLSASKCTVAHSVLISFYTMVLVRRVKLPVTDLNTVGVNSMCLP